MVERCHSVRTTQSPGPSTPAQHHHNGTSGPLPGRRRRSPNPLAIPILLLQATFLAHTLLQGAQATRVLSLKQIPTGLSCDFEKECEWSYPPMAQGFVSFRLVSGTEITQWHTEGMSAEYSFLISGPDVDTEGNTYGHFLYLGLWENSTSHSNNLTQITSPWYERSGENCRLEFDLHTKNVHDVQNLVKVLIDYNNSRPIFVEMENKDSLNTTAEWRHKKTTIGMIDKKFRLSIEVELSTRRPSHVAIDNIKLLDCVNDYQPEECSGIRCQNTVCVPKNMICDLHRHCQHGEDENVCDGYPEGARCDFELGLCGWKNNNKDEMDWVHYQGSGIDSTRGPSGDHTNVNGTGFYMLSQLPTNGIISDQAILESPMFEPPPCYHRDQNSNFYESCRIRLFYHKEGRNQGSLRLEVIERDGSRDGNSRLLVQMTGDQGGDWKRLIKTLPITVVHPYQIRVVNVRAMRYTGDMGLDDISLSPECFGLGVTSEAAAKCPIETTTEAVPTIRPPEDGVGWLMTSCGASGREGPKVEECQKAYQTFPQPHAAVTEDNSASIVNGLQKWRVPADGYYTIITMGASGGTGVQSQDQRSRGSQSRGVFYLKAKDVLYIMVGQEGESACDNNKSDSPVKNCNDRNDPPHDEAFDQMNEVEMVRKMNQSPYGGGGGGGGASVVYKVVDGKATPMVVAGGGGGLGWVNTTVRDIHNGRGINTSLQDSHGKANYNGSSSGAGPGGGWRGTSTGFGSEGQSLLKGGRGGDLCKGSTTLGYRGFGGYGGGGGACLAGGGGGGYTGGDSHKGARQHGEGGMSFLASEAEWTLIQPGEHEGNGRVYIMTSRKDVCGSMECDYECLALDSSNLKHTCICAPNWILDQDHKTCLPPGASFFLQTTYLIFIIFGIVVIILISSISIFCYNRYQRKKFRDTRANFFDPGVQLRNIREGHGMLTEYNPNYEFGGSTITIKELREIPRENLTLIKALGQGAFGEVYQGYLKHYAGDHVEMPVAVKTLPEMSTSQSQMDFLMEALIMSKFNHPNIVHFIGVCFDKLPRFIVLELLSGGDLKSFLREARPKPDKPSALSMKDLLTCAMDVIKGCEYLEEHHFIHRDIAARNCLLTTKGPGRVVKIADFGMARDIYRNDYYRKGGKAMLPVKWMPPEAFLDGIFTSKTDVWSFGVLLWEVMSLGYMPYPGRGNQDVMHLVTNGGRLEAPSNCPSPIYHIMTQCWHPIPDDRPTFTTLLERLGYCVQDPDVLSHALPVFQRPPSTERDATIMRPLDNEACLQVTRSGNKEPQSPGSQDYLIPLPSSYSLSTVRSELNSTPSLDSGADCCQLERLIDEPPTLPPPVPPPVWETSFSHEPQPQSPTQASSRTSPPEPQVTLKTNSRTPTHGARGGPPSAATVTQAEAQVPLLRSSPPLSPTTAGQEGQEMPLLRRSGSSTSTSRAGATPLEGAVGTSTKERPHRRNHHYHPHRYNNSGSSNNSSSSQCSNSSSSTAGGSSSSSSSTLPLDPGRGSNSTSNSTLPLDPGQLPTHIPPPLHYANVDCSKDRSSRELHDAYIIHETREHREISC